MNHAHTVGFNKAIVELKNGGKVARTGWNGKGMFVWLKPGSAPAALLGASDVNNVRATLFEPGDTGSVTRMPCLCLRAADGSTVEGWLASQTDMLAEDWEILP